MISRYQFRDYHWLEAELSGILLWEPAVSLEVLGGLQRLFRQSSSLWPDRRPSVAAFRARLRELRALVEEKEPIPQETAAAAIPAGSQEQTEEDSAYFTVLLINTSVPGSWLSSYAAAARNFWEDQRTALIEAGIKNPVLYVGMIRYWDALMPDAACADLPRPLTVWPIDKFTDSILPSIPLRPALSNSPEGLCQAIFSPMRARFYFRCSPALPPAYNILPRHQRPGSGLLWPYRRGRRPWFWPTQSSPAFPCTPRW